MNRADLIKRGYSVRGVVGWSGARALVTGQRVARRGAATRPRSANPRCRRAIYDHFSQPKPVSVDAKLRVCRTNEKTFADISLRGRSRSRSMSNEISLVTTTLNDFAIYQLKIIV